MHEQLHILAVRSATLFVFHLLTAVPFKVITVLMKPLMDPSWDDVHRVVTRATLLKLLAEYVKSYSSAASIIADAAGSRDQTAMVTILEACFSSATPDPELVTALKTFARAMASCAHSAKVASWLFFCQNYFIAVSYGSLLL